MSEDPLDRPATPEEIEMVERQLKQTRSAKNVVQLPKAAVGAEEFEGVQLSLTDAIGEKCNGQEPAAATVVAFGTKGSCSPA